MEPQGCGVHSIYELRRISCYRVNAAALVLTGLVPASTGTAVSWRVQTTGTSAARGGTSAEFPIALLVRFKSEVRTPSESIAGGLYFCICDRASASVSALMFKRYF